MSVNISIRIARKADASAMVELWKEMMDFHEKLDRLFTRAATSHKTWTEFVAGQMKNKNSRVLVAECGGRIVGHCLAFVENYPPVITTKRYGLFKEMVVAADYRRCGVGEKLVKKMLKWFTERGIKRVEVRVSVRNELSTAFWRKMGFTPYIETLFLEMECKS